MLGIVFVYYIWKYLADLATKFGKHRQGFGWLGILVYFLGTFIGGFSLGLVSVFLDISIEENQTLINLITIPIGFLAVYLLYFVLNKNWTSQVSKVESIDDIGRTT